MRILLGALLLVGCSQSNIAIDAAVDANDAAAAECRYPDGRLCGARCLSRDSCNACDCMNPAGTFACTRALCGTPDAGRPADAPPFPDCRGPADCPPDYECLFDRGCAMTLGFCFKNAFFCPAAPTEKSFCGCDDVTFTQTVTCGQPSRPYQGTGLCP